MRLLSNECRCTRKASATEVRVILETVIVYPFSASCSHLKRYGRRIAGIVIAVDMVIVSEDMCSRLSGVIGLHM